MQINNNYQSPNFGMSLRVMYGGKEFLEKESTKTIQKLRELGEEFRDYKHWDMVVDQNGYHAVPKDRFAQAYTDIGKAEQLHTDTIGVSATAERFADEDKRVTSYLIYSNSDAAKAAYAKLSETNSQVDKTAEFIRQQEIIDTAKAAKKEAENKAKMAHIADIQDLFSKFGTPDGEI